MERSFSQLYLDGMGWDWLDGMVIKVVGSLRAPLVLIMTDYDDIDEENAGG